MFLPTFYTLLCEVITPCRLLRFATQPTTMFALRNVSTWSNNAIEKGEVDTRMMSVLLMGVNRAYPFAKTEMQHISEHVETMYKVVHLASFNVSLHTLCLLYHVCDHANTMSDRFYCALYKKIADPGLMISCHQAMFLSLVFRALRKDTHAARIRAFVKRLLQVCLYSPVPLACGILYMISQLVYRRGDLLALSCSASFVDDCDDDGDEHYEDVKLQEQSSSDDESAPAVVKEEEDVKPATWMHGDNLRRVKGRSQYNPHQRNPTFAGAEHTTYVELLELARHFHPTVALFANNIMQGVLINYSGDPLLDFTVARFLDRFVFKNPKKQPKEDVIVHPFDRKKQYVASGARALRVDSTNYLNLEEGSIPEDERFLYRYLYARQTKAVDGEGDNDADSVASDEFEEMLDGLTGARGDDQLLDFADHISKKQVDSKRKRAIEADGSDEGSAEEDDVSDEEASDDDNEGADESIPDDSSDIVFDSDDEKGDEEDIVNELKEFKFGGEAHSQMSRKAKLKMKKKQATDMRSMFASADEFAEILQDEGSSGQITDLSNKDNAGLKQLNWESARNFWLHRNDKRRNKGPASKTKKLRKK